MAEARSLHSSGATENAAVEMNDVARIRNGQNISTPEEQVQHVTRQTNEIVFVTI